MSDTTLTAIMGAVTVLIGLVIGICIGADVAHISDHIEAIKHGAGHFDLMTDDFVWGGVK